MATTMLGPSEDSLQSAGITGGFNDFSFSSHPLASTQEEGNPPPTQGPWFKSLEAQALAEDFLHIDHEVTANPKPQEFHPFKL